MHSQSSIINEDALNNKAVKDFQKAQIEKAQTEIDQIEEEIKQLEQN